MNFAERLDEAERTRTAIPQVVSQSGADAGEAYRIQEALVALRVGRGERLVGLKLGLTSRAKMAQVGVDQVIWGRLTDAMRIEDGGTVDAGRYIHPRVEPEVAFRLDATGAATAVAPALELIDSRYADFKFALPDVIADNTSAAAFVVGAWQPLPAGLDNLGVLLEVDGRVTQIGSTAAILGDPRRAVTAAATLAASAGVPLEDGWVLLAGAATAAVPLAPGAHVRAVVEGLGTASLRALS
ncbi:4-oxalocrotonate decarboxylase [Dactylosporangium sp. AC04546]|uniref:2-keto-4-pentenoate hydratase n=1 Tax=Dactylosporangium sp. AC04546 TaxID=2862460 RepID=UPI001EDDCB38|nr:4-oxalocrotonate decarboxylase [Dactylosporangium sp. AC04546]WVK81113.1 4-oxalocrotonate decarboxylase [Dactylosporangium sp. AC04546]